MIKYFLFVLLLAFSVFSSAQAESVKKSQNLENINSKKPIDLVTTSAAKKEEKYCCNEYSKNLSEERKYIEEQADKQYSRFWDFVSFAGKIILGIAAIVLAFLAWFLPKSWSDMKERAETIVDKLFREEGLAIINREAGNVKEVVAGMKNEIENLVRYKKGRIVWVFEHDRITADDEIKALYAQGFERIDVFTPANGEAIDIGDADLVIVSYDKTDESKRRLRLVIEGIHSSSPPIHLIVYTFNQGTPVRISDPDENQILSQYKWHIMANFPSTLVGHVNLLVRQTRIPAERGING